MTVDYLAAELEIAEHDSDFSACDDEDEEDQAQEAKQVVELQ